MADNINSQKYKPYIDGLRALAVLSVIGFHFAPGRMPGGFVGVDVFFVISGYLISGIMFEGLDQNKFSILNFYNRRIRRIFPALIIVMLSIFAFGYLYMTIDEFSDIGRHTFGGAVFIDNILTMNAKVGYFFNTQPSPLLHLWSLGIEEQFYLFWPILLVFGWKYFRENIFAIIFVIAALSFVLNLVVVSNYPKEAFLALPTRLWELAIGGLLAYRHIFAGSAGRHLFRGMGQGLGPNLQSALGLSAVFGAIFFLNANTVYPGVAALLPILGTCLIINAGQHAALNRSLLSNRAAIFFGMISYPLYLWHFPLITLWQSSAFRLNIHSPLVTYLYEHNKVLTLVLFAMSVGLSWIVYRFVEVPIRSRRGKAGSLKAIGLFTAMCSVAALGLVTWKTNGLTGRFPDELIRLRFNLPSIVAEWREHRCFLDVMDTTFAKECTGNPKDGDKVILLWGDSYAAGFYPGLRAMEKRTKNLTVAQYTANGCPPILGKYELPAARPNCNAVNDLAFAKIAELKPDLVILQAHWLLYPLDLLDQTLSAVKQAGAKVVLIGQTPTWQLGVPDLAINYWRKHGSLLRGMHTDYLLDDEVFTSEPVMRAIAERNDIAYIAPATTMCEGRKCVWNVSQDPNSISFAYFDYGHISPPGATYFIKVIEKELLALAGAAAMASDSVANEQGETSASRRRQTQ